MQADKSPIPPPNPVTLMKDQQRILATSDRSRNTTKAALIVDRWSHGVSAVMVRHEYGQCCRRLMKSAEQWKQTCDSSTVPASPLHLIANVCLSALQLYLIPPSCVLSVYLLSCLFVYICARLLRPVCAVCVCLLMLMSCLCLPACLIILYWCVLCMCVSGLFSERRLVLLVIMVTVYGALRWWALPADAHMHKPRACPRRGHLHWVAYRGGFVQHTHLPG